MVNNSSNSIDPNQIDQVRQRVSFVELASEFLDLKQSGSRFVGLCPFHSEKTPSFSLNEEEGLFYCFGCGKKGTIFDFLMEMRGYSFPEAVRVLAAKAGVTLTNSRTKGFGSSRLGSEQGAQFADEQREFSSRELYALMGLASELYQRELTQSSGAKHARDYLEQRNIDLKIAQQFGLGFAPESWSFIARRCQEELDRSKSAASTSESAEEADPKSKSHSVLEHYSPEQLERMIQAVGLVKNSKPDSGKTARSYDAFRGRLLFPIKRSDGAVMAFGARVLTAEHKGPKYINSSESEIYSKRRSFYGLAEAMPLVRSTRHVFLVEGYMDVLAMHQKGLSNTVGSCGTAITADHVRILTRLCDRVSLVFDGDSAGRKAAASCFELFLGSGIEAEVITLPDGEDPDSVARRCTATEFAELFSGASQSVLEIYLRHSLVDLSGVDLSGVDLSGDSDQLAGSPALIGKVAERCAKLLASVKNPIERDLLMTRAAAVLGVRFESLERIVDGELRKGLSNSNYGSNYRGNSWPDNRQKQWSGTERTSGRLRVSPGVGQGRDPQRSSFQNNNRGQWPGASRDSSAEFFAGEEDLTSSSNPRARAELSSYQMQLLVAVIHDPRLAQAVLESPGLESGPVGFGAGILGSALLGAEGQRSNDPASGLSSSLAQRIFGFLEEISLGDFGGVRLWISGKQTSELAAEGDTAVTTMAVEEGEKFIDLLAKYELSSFGLLEEAIRQGQVGGSRPAKVIADRQKVAQSRSLRDDLEQIRTQEKNCPDVTELERLAQEKLKTKRRLQAVRLTD